MTMEVVMDTNVAVVANGEAEQAGPECVATCMRTLRRIRNDHRLVLDDQGHILDEYRRRLSPNGQPRVGDAFFKWLWENQANESRCLQVRITFDPEREYEEFPDDPELGGFDRSDRKFVAVARVTSSDPAILNASDTDWWHHRKPLWRHGIRIEFLCPELMRG